jgi:hypothetical protein
MGWQRGIAACINNCFQFWFLEIHHRILGTVEHISLSLNLAPQMIRSSSCTKVSEDPEELLNSVHFPRKCIHCELGTVKLSLLQWHIKQALS